MGWEKRGNGSYYYLKIRDGKRVRSKYMGKEADAQGCAMRIRNAQRNRAVEQEIRKADADMDRQLEAAGAAVYALTDAALCAAGCHKHKGQWRKRHATAAGTR